MGFSRQEYWSGLPFPIPGDHPNPGINPTSPVSPALAGRFFTTMPPGKPFIAHVQNAEPGLFRWSESGLVKIAGSIEFR